MAESIWNNNYLLANGAVSANAPLSGDGSNVSPLGIVESAMPYNETVLWSNGNSAQNGLSAVTLSEPVENFHKLRISFGIDSTVTYPTISTQVVDMDALSAANRTDVTLVNSFINGSNNAARTRMLKTNLSGNKFLPVTGVNWWQTNYEMVQTSGWIHIYQVVGINRR